MVDITAALVKELRDKTGAGMMDCKNALKETGGDIEAGVDWLRTKGLAAAAKKAGRVASEGFSFSLTVFRKKSPAPAAMLGNQPKVPLRSFPGKPLVKLLLRLPPPTRQKRPKRRPPNPPPTIISQ